MKIWNNPFRKILLFSLLLLSFSSAQAEENQKETLLFLPLDNRPVCSSYVAKTMEAAGYKVLLPPDKYLASYNRNGSPDELWKWLVSRAPQADAAVISTRQSDLRRSGCITYSSRTAGSFRAASAATRNTA